MENKTNTGPGLCSCGKGPEAETDKSSPLQACPHCGVKIPDPRELLIHIFHCHPA